MDNLNNSTPLKQYAINDELLKDKERINTTTLNALFSQDPKRFDTFSVESASLFLDYSKNLIDETTLSHLITLAEEAHVPTAISAMFNGEKINTTEERAVLHTALRNLNDTPVMVNDENVMQSIDKTLEGMRTLTDQVHNQQWKGWSGKPIQHIVNIGIGGSYLGIKTVLDALKPYHHTSLQPHFVANIDPADLANVCKKIDPETTLFIVASKSFNTLETLHNTMTAKKWMLDQGMPDHSVAQHFIAISCNVEKATEFGIAKENIFPLWDWVGGRYSLWSAIGMMIPMIIGFNHFTQLLEGAHHLDEHFRTAPLNQNMPVLLATLGIWYHNYFGAESYAILPYDSSLETFADHLQQVDMESNGKTVTLTGQPIPYHTGPIIWGNVGTNGQHAYHQLLHQGSRLIPVDFIVPLTSHYSNNEQQTHLVANAFAQSQALMQGKTLEDAKSELLAQGKTGATIKTLAPHKAIPGNRPSNTLTMKKLTPATMGALIALYEHKVFVQGIIWSINSFDQWGVELGKVLGNKVFSQLSGETTFDTEDASTQGLIKRFKDSQ